LRAMAGYRNENMRNVLHVTDVITRTKDYQTKWWQHIEMEMCESEKSYLNIIQQVKKVQKDHRSFQ